MSKSIYYLLQLAYKVFILFLFKVLELDFIKKKIVSILMKYVALTSKEIISQ